MYELSLADLDQLILDGRKAVRYAWDHYEELASRKSAYTLYGPYSYYLGAGIPGGATPKRERKLSKQTRRADYMVYELDSDYKLLCTKAIRNHTKVEIVYYCFELDGIQYGCPFYSEQKKLYRTSVFAIGSRDGRPWYLGILSAGVVTANFYDYVSPEKMRVTGYEYSKGSTYSPCSGEPVDYNAPIGEGSSPVRRGCWEEDAVFTDFSQWFR